MSLSGWIFTVVLFLFGISLIFYVVYTSVRNTYGKTKSVKAKVSEKSASVQRDAGNVLVSDDGSEYIIVFESDDKTLEFSAPLIIYQSLNIGDEGILKYQGKKLISFNKN